MFCKMCYTNKCELKCQLKSGLHSNSFPYLCNKNITTQDFMDSHKIFPPCACCNNVYARFCLCPKTTTITNIWLNTFTKITFKPAFVCWCRVWYFIYDIFDGIQTFLSVQILCSQTSVSGAYRKVFMSSTQWAHVILWARDT